MEKAYKRIDKIETIIQSAKLPYNAWKVLFVLDKETSAAEIASLLGEEISVVEQALERLAVAGLLETAKVPEVAPETEHVDADMEVTVEVSIKEEPPAKAPEEESAAWPVIEPEIAEEEPTVVAEEGPRSEAGDEPDPEKVEESVEELIPGSGEEVISELDADVTDSIEDLITETEPAPSLDEALSPEIDLEPDKVEESTPLEEAEKPVESIMDNLPGDDLDVVIPTEPDVSTEEKESLDVDFELDQPAVSEEELTPAPDVEPKAADGTKTILVIDDSIVIRKMVEIALEDEDEILIETSVSGKEGLDKLDEVNADLVLLDMMLPDINGVEILKTIKASKGIPVIILSGKDSPQLVEKARSEGADEFLPKPFKDDELVEKIKTSAKVIKSLRKNANEIGMRV